MSDSGYPYIFTGVDTHCTDEYQQDSLLFCFESEKSHHTYTVRIERYVNGLYCVKFFDSTTSKNELASFLFIGASDGRDVKGMPTRRYRVYKQYLSDFDLREWFERADYEKHSMYVLVNLKAMPTREERYSFRKQIEEFAGIISPMGE